MGITKHIPNTITSCNLICGCIATGCAMHNHYTSALLFIILGAVFDFFDGMSARLLHVSSEIGKELDSLADDVTFGVAPAAMVYSVCKSCTYPDYLAGLAAYLPFLAFIMAAFSAVRLAKFNLDTRQTSSFIGLPTPANALFWGALIVAHQQTLTEGGNEWIGICMLLGTFLFSYLLVAEFPMFALKFKNLSWEDNKIKYLFVLSSIALIVVLGISGISAVILWYIILSAFTQNK